MESPKSFEARVSRIMQAAGVTKDSELAKVLGINQSSVAAARKRQQVPSGWIEHVCEKFRVNANWLFFGEEGMRSGEAVEPGASIVSPVTKNVLSEEFEFIPLVEARLSAGAGCFETSDYSDRSYAFRYDFLVRKGDPKKMVLMRVAGDSMEPEIYDNDMVLIDQSKKDIIPGKMFAVGFEEAIYLKRINILPGKIIMESMNPRYAPMEFDMRGDCSEHFRVIGRVLWTCREYR